MDSAEAPSVSSPPGEAIPKVNFLSPGGKSRYGRTRRPKISHDFYNTDDVVIDENPAPRHSPVRSPKQKPPTKSPIIGKEVIFEVKDEFTKIDDLGMKVANNFKTNLQRGMDASIKERKFFKTMPENKVNVPVVDVTKVFKLISMKPTVSEMCEVKTTPKTALKTYSNKRKHLHDSDNIIVESFGLPDEPIIPVNNPLSFERDMKIDVDMSCEVDVNLANPWLFELFEPMPLYASEPLEEFQDFNRGGMFNLLPYEDLMTQNSNNVLGLTSNCQSDTNFEKSRIPTPIVPQDEMVSAKSPEKMVKEVMTRIKIEEQQKKQEEAKNKRLPLQVIKLPEKKKETPSPITKTANVIVKKTNKTSPFEVIDLSEKKKETPPLGMKSNDTKKGKQERSKSKDLPLQIIDLTEKKVEKPPLDTKSRTTKAIIKKLSPLKKKPNIDLTSRILRSTVDNNNIEEKKDTTVVSSLESKITAKNNCKSTSSKGKSKTKVINPVNALNSICNRQVKVILNPLACLQFQKKLFVPNPFKIKSDKAKLKEKQRLRTKSRTIFQQKHKLTVRSREIHEEKNAVKKDQPNEAKADIKEEKINVKDIKTELIEFEVGDLTWAKIGTYPYWPCMVTQEPTSGNHKKKVVNRVQPLYHVRFFGDKGRRSWVSAQHVMLFYGRDDLDRLSKVLKGENKIQVRLIRESYEVKPAKLEKWQRGVKEAEALKCKSVQERLDYFFETFASSREKQQRLKEQGIKILDENIKSEAGESPIKSKKRPRISQSIYLNKKVKAEILDKQLSSEDSETKQKEHAEIESKKVKKLPEGTRKESPSKKTKKNEVGSPQKRRNSPEKKLLTSGNKEKPSETVTSPDARKNRRKTSQSNEEMIMLMSPEKPKKADKFPEDLIKKGDPVIQNKFPDKKKKVIKPSADEQTYEDLPLSDRLSQDLQKSARKSDTNLSSDSRKKYLKKEEFSEESLAARKKLRIFPPKPEEEPPPKEIQETPPQEAPKIQEVPKISKRTSTEESVQQEEDKEPKLKNKRHQIPGEYSNSDTDSKFSDNSSVPASLESQAALFRRNNIFRGIPREKVCQVCEKAGEVFKCKGPCNGVYHYTCAAKSDKVKPIEQHEEKTKETDKTEEEKKDEGADKPNNVEIVSVNSKIPLPNLTESPNYKGMTLAEKIDFRMKEIMKKFDYQSIYCESTDSSSEEFLAEESFEKLKTPSKLSLTVTNKPSKKEVPIIKHVTADNISYICVTNEKPKEKDTTYLIKEDLKIYKCSWCTTDETPRCLVCNKEESKTGSKFRQKCSLHQCGKYYHPECLKTWPQTQWSLIQSTKDKKSDAQYDTFVCPRHVCHTCISDDPRAAISRCTSDKVVKCLRCPATYHSSNYCVPAGSQILSTSQIVCPRHCMPQRPRNRMQQTINTNWCFICSKGGNLICCETCPTSVHVECLPVDLNEDDTFFCEDCQSGRLPLYDEIVWVKLGKFRWWPALILFPNEIPDNVRNRAHNKGEFVVKFYGTYDHYWIGRGRTFLFQEGDKGHSNYIRKKVDSAFQKAIEEAAVAHQLKKKFKLTKVAEKNSGLKPPPYIRIKVNRPVGNVRLFDGNTSNTTSCDCDPDHPHPCGPDSDCLNRLLLTECNPDVCPAGERCNNQRFEKREYPPLVPHRTQGRGWGLKTLAPIRRGQFVIEYVGEIIDEQEYQRRVQKMHEKKEENYYFLTIDKDRTLDAGPKGNVARFMNHSCQPNCETQKWTVNGDTRVGLFANCDIPADTELTFNYNLECIGKEKKICRCGAPNCNGFIGVKVKTDGSSKKSVRPKRKKTPPPPEIIENDNPCFVCGKVGDVNACNNKICTKYYHLECVGLNSWPEGGKWVCQWHNCNICAKRTIRCCAKCLNSYCPSHSEGFVRYHAPMAGFVCFEHDPINALQTIEVSEKDDSTCAEEEMARSTTVEEDVRKTAAEVDDDLDCMSLSMRLNGCVTSTPLKQSKEESSQDESTVSSVKRKRGRPGKKTKKKNHAKVEVKSHVKNTANLFHSMQNEIKLTNFTPVKYLRTNRSSAKVFNSADRAKSDKDLPTSRTDPDKDLPIRKRNRLRCGNTL